MVLSRSLSTELLSAELRRLKDQGYEIVMEPSGDLLPDALRKIRLDAVAIGEPRNLAIEVVTDESRDRDRVLALRQALADVEGWELRLVVYTGSTAGSLPTVSDATLGGIMSKVRALAEVEPRAALLTCWASFEALARQRRPAHFSKPQSPGRIIEVFASEGAITHQQAVMLRRLAGQRNEFVHGNLESSVSIDEVMQFAALIDEMRADLDYIT